MEDRMISTAHEYMQALPLVENVLVCAACGYRRLMAAPELQRCHPHYVFLSAGWRS